MLPGASSLYRARSRLAAADWMPKRATKSWRRISPMKRTRNSTNARRSRCGWVSSASCSIDISLIDIAVESWRFSRLFGKVVSKLDALASR
jgi:hypothetical protein